MKSLLGAAALAVACGAPASGPTATGPTSAPASSAEESAPDAAKSAKSAKSDQSEKKAEDPLFPTRKKGWKSLASDDRSAAVAMAADYLDFIDRAKTPRRAITALVDVAREVGGAALDSSAASGPKPGGLYYFVARGGDAAALYRRGIQPVSDGVQLIVVSVDAPRVELKQTPVYEKHGIAMMQTALHGRLDWKSWMVHPIALYVFVDRGAGRPTDVVIGEAADDPVLSIPDLLPHLSRGVQRRDNPVDSPERLDALAGAGRAASTLR